MVKLLLVNGPKKNERPFINNSLLANGPFKLLEGKHRGLSSQQKKHKPSIKTADIEQQIILYWLMVHTNYWKASTEAQI